ncbi:hypothetical protein [Clostridium perfringens]|nr:hypothetical protein [Clostridium perfringens]MDH5085199.1 hypothetical protein [Clostridium perfringens]
MDEKAREERNAYLREWRKRNKDKVKKYNNNYWERKANKKIKNIIKER